MYTYTETVCVICFSITLVILDSSNSPGLRSPGIGVIEVRLAFRLFSQKRYYIHPPPISTSNLHVQGVLPYVYFSKKKFFFFVFRNFFFLNKQFLYLLKYIL